MSGTKGKSGVYKRTPEHIEKLRCAKLGENNSFYGKHHTEESKNKISIAKKGKN